MVRVPIQGLDFDTSVTTVEGIFSHVILGERQQVISTVGDIISSGVIVAEDMHTGLIADFVGDIISSKIITATVIT